LSASVNYTEKNKNLIMKKAIITFFILAALLLILPDFLVAQAPPPPPPTPSQSPIDGGLGLLALAGGAYAYRKLKSKIAE
jgi:hypothetical protein